MKCYTPQEERPHPDASPLSQDDGSELYLCKDLTQSIRREREQEGEMEKQLLFSNIPMLAIMCQTNKSGRIEAHSPATHHQLGSPECESQTFGLTPCQRQSNHLPILDLSLG